MNEEALNDAYALFSSKGYNGNINEFKSLIASNPDALKDSYTLFRSGGYNGDIDQYSELVGVKKKELSEVSGSQFLGEPSASATSRKQTEAERIGIDKTKLYQDAAMSIIRQGVESGDISEDVVVKNSNQPENIFLAVASARAAKDKTVSPEQERAAALLQNRQRSGEVTAPLESELKTLTQRNEQQKVERQNQQLQAEIQQKVKQAVINSIPEDKVGDKEYIQKIEDDLFLNQGLALDITGDRKINDQGVASDAISSLAAGLGSLNLGFRSVTDKIVGAFGIPVNTELPKTLLDESRRNAITTFEQDFYDSVKDGNFSNAARQAINLTAESAPLTVAAAALSYTGNPYAAYATVSALASVQTYGQVQNEEWFKELSPLAQLGYISSTGAAEGVGEMAGGRVLNRAIRGLANSATKEASQKALKEYITGMIRAGAINVSEESIGEGITGGSQYVIDALAKGEAVTANGFLDAFKRSAASGAAMAGVISTPTSAASTASYLANKIGSNYQVRKIDNAIKSAKESLLSTENPEDHSVIVSNIVELQKVRNNFVNTDVKFYENMSDEDRNRIFVLNAQVEELSNKNKVTTSEEAKNIIKQDVASKIEEIKQIESRYDRQEEVGAPSPVVEGEAVIEAQPIEGAGQEAPEAGRVLQVPVEEGAEATKEELGPAVEDITFGTAFDLQDETAERTVSDKNAWGGSGLIRERIENAGDILRELSSRGDRPDPGYIQEKIDKLRSWIPDNASVRSNAIPSDIKTIDDFNKTNLRFSNVTDGFEYLMKFNSDVVNKIRSEYEAIPTYTKEQKLAKDSVLALLNQDITGLEKNLDNLQDVVDTVKKEGKLEIVKSVDPEVAVPTQEAAAEVTEAVAVEPAVGVTEPAVEQATEQVEESIGADVKNKRGIDQEDIDKSVGNAFRLLRNAGSDVKIVTFKNTEDYNKAIAENSKSGVDETAIEQGRYLPSSREIYINLEEMDTVTPFHEVFHAIFIDRYTSKGKDPKETQANRERVAKNFYTQLRGILMDGTANDRVIAESADIFASESGYSISEQPEEFLAQVAGYLANNVNKISKSTVDKVLQWISKFINKYVPGVNITSRGELIDFMNSFSGAMFELSGRPAAPTVNLTSTKDLLESASRGAFTISYFEDTDQYRKFVDDGLVVNNFNLDQIAGQPVATHQPDNFMVGDVKLGDKVVVEGDGGVYFVLKFGEVWASGKPSSASGIAKAINWSRENSTDGKGRMLLARGTTPKLISSTKGVKGGMQILEEMVERNLIPRKDFRASLIRVGKKYGIDFSGNDSMTSIKKDIEQKFMKPSDSTFAKRGSFFEDLISDISSTSTASKENIDGIRKFLGSKKRISFSKEGITSAIAELMTERMLIDLPSSHAYAVIEVDNDVKVEKSKKHDSYPYSIVQVDGKRPTLYLLKERPKAVPSLLTKDGERATNAKVGFAQMGYGRAIVDPALAAEAEQQNKPVEALFKESQSKRYKEGIQDSEISNQVEDKISNDPTWKARERTQFERFIDLSRVKIQDKLFGAIKLQEDIEYAKERPVKLDEDFKNAEVLMHGKAEEDIKKTEELAVDIIKSIKNAGLDLQSFDDLLYAIHAQERNRYLRIQSADIYKSIKKLREEANLKPSEVAEATGILVEDYRKIEDGTIERGITNEELANIVSLFGKTPAQFFYENALSKNGSGMTDDEAQMILSAYGLDKYNPDINKLRPDIRDAVKKTYEITNDTRNRMLEFGLETQETIDTYNNTYKNYVPLRGFADDKYDSEIIGNGNGIEVRSKEKRSKGRESKADSPFAQIIAQNQAAIIRGRKNEVANRLYELAKNNPNPEIFEVIDPAVDKNYKKDVTPQGIRLTAKTVFDYMKKPENFSVLVNGEYKFIKFADPRIADQLRNASVVKSDFIVKYIGWYSRLLSKLITQYNPTFVLTNFFRDIQTAIVNSISEQEIEGGLLKGKNITFKIFKSTFPSIKAIFDVEFNRNANAEYAKYYKEFKEDGGKTGWFYSKSVDELKTDFERLINGKGQGVAKNAASIIERVNSSVENGVRLSAYIESRKAGLSREKAAELAKNLTINFNKSGSLGPSANALYLFFNASVQGTSRLIRTLKPQYRKNDDGSRSLYMTNAQKIMTSVFVFGGVMSIINELISDDDEDGKSFYSKIPEFEKERNIIFMNPDGKTYEKWPLPYGFNVFYVAGNAIGEASQGLKSSATVLGNIFEATVGSFSPINFPSSDEFSNWFFKFITPTFLQIPLAIQMNENYFGQTIYNENFPLDPTPKPDSELGRKGATPWSTAIAKGLNELTGGSEFRSGFRDINPDAIDFVSETVLGGTGRFVSRSTSVLANLLTGNADKIEVNKIPIVSTFYGQPVKYTDLQDYFDKRIEVNQYMEEVKADKITGAEKSRIKEMYGTSKAVDKALRGLREAEKKAENIEDENRREARLNEIEMKRYAQIAKFQKAYEQYKIDEL
jgi:transcriptional regulator with XRE-family HTH domain